MAKEKRKKPIKTLRKKKKIKQIQRFTQIQNLGGNQLTAKEFRTLQKMAHSSKALRNVGLYTIKKCYQEKNRKATTKEIDDAMKADVNYWGLQSNSVQAVRRSLLTELTSFFESLQAWKEDPTRFTGRPKFPRYLKSEDKRVIEIYQIPKVDENGYWTLPMNTQFKKKHGSIQIKMPKNLRHRKVTYIEIIPKQKGRFFEVHYTYEVHVPQMKKQPTTTTNALSIDLGIDNLMSCATNNGDTFLIDGLVLKSLNRYFNKEIGKQQQKNIENGLSKRLVTRCQAALWMKRERQINGYISQAIGLLFKKVKEFNIDTIVPDASLSVHKTSVVGYNNGWKQASNLGRTTNQHFVQIPFARIIDAIENKCLKEGVRFKKQEESYTSKASFLDGDKLPVWSKEEKKNYEFSGKRFTRGMYRSKNGRYIHADINGALNILRKAEVVDIPSSLNVKTPIRLRVQQRKAVA